MALLEIKNLKKYYPVRGMDGLLHAVDDVNLSIEEGATLGVVGESGCGKSTLGKTIVRLENPTSGQVFFDGVEVGSMPEKEFKPMRMQMQMIFQDPFSSLDPRKTVTQLIAEPLKIYKVCKSKGELNDRVAELMQTAGIDERFKSAYPHEMDGGRRQRVGIARALALNPRFIVCDEPVSALDVSIQAQVLNLLQDLQESKHLTYMFITHDMSVVKHISTNICVMYLGQVVEFCRSAELFAHTIHPYSRALLSAIPEPSIHNRKERILLQGEITSPIDPEPCCRFAKRCVHACDRCLSEEPKLRDVGNGHMVACHRAEEFL